MSIKNPYENIRFQDCFVKHRAFDEGVKSTMQYLGEPCSEHLVIFSEGTEIDTEMFSPAHSGTLYYSYNHRYNCPDCMEHNKRERDMNIGVTCPFCKEICFDLIGLKDHLENNCINHQGTLSIEEEQGLRKIREDIKKGLGL